MDRAAPLGRSLARSTARSDWADWAKIQHSHTYWRRWHELEELRRLEGFFTLDEFFDAMNSFMQTRVEDQLVSESSLLQGLAMLDRRLGKRRFLRLGGMHDAHPFVQLLYRVRGEAEQWPASPVDA